MGFSMHNTAAPHSTPFQDLSFSQRTGTGDIPAGAGSSVGREQRAAPGGLKTGLRAPVTVLSSGAQGSCEKGNGENDFYCSPLCG